MRKSSYLGLSFKSTTFKENPNHVIGVKAESLTLHFQFGTYTLRLFIVTFQVEIGLLDRSRWVMAKLAPLSSYIRTQNLPVFRIKVLSVLRAQLTSQIYLRNIKRYAFCKNNGQQFSNTIEKDLFASCTFKRPHCVFRYYKRSLVRVQDRNIQILKLQPLLLF